METATIMVITESQVSGKEQTHTYEIKLPDYFAIDATNAGWLEIFRKKLIDLYYYLPDAKLVDAKFDALERQFKTSM